jgi:hypothetical protein
MGMRTKMALGFGTAALVIGSAVPASAGRYDGRWRHHRHDDGTGAGAVIGAIVGIGIIAAIAAAASRKKDAEAGDRGHDRPYGEDDRGYDDRMRGGQRQDDGRSASSEDDAVDACAVAARDEAARSGGFADIGEITGVHPDGGGYDVTGTIDQRSSYSARDSWQRSFRCTYESGHVNAVMFGDAV